MRFGDSSFLLSPGAQSVSGTIVVVLVVVQMVDIAPLVRAVRGCGLLRGLW